MSSERKSDKRQSTPVPDAPEPSEASHSKERTPESVEPRKALEDKDHLGKEPAVAPPKPSDDDSTTHSPSEDTADDEPEPASSPCTCRCGGCCCHTTQSDPHHCVRCHADYTLNHPEACSVPHVFYQDDLTATEVDVADRDVVVRSLCCGSDVCGAEPIKGDWEHPATCFLGWHTTDVDAVEQEEQYNGLNVVRCDPDPEHGGKCRRKHLKFLNHGRYEHVFDDQVEYNKGDVEDREAHLERMEEEIDNDWQFNMVFKHVATAECIGKKRKRGRN